MTTTRISCSTPRGLRAQRGMTFVSTAVTTVLAGVILLGGWVAYRNFRIQEKVANADRQMDQYSQATFQEFTNLLGWGWWADQIQGGSRNPIWRFRVYDLSVPGSDFARLWKYGNRLRDSLMTVTYVPSRGVMLGGREPLWQTQGSRSQYVWRGQRARGGELRAYDRRDQLTIQGLTIEYTAPQGTGLNPRTLGAVTINLTLQYRYRATGSSGEYFGMFDQEYIRERTYKTTIFQRNWDVKSNPDRDRILGL